MIMKINASHGSLVSINLNGFKGKPGRDSLIAPGADDVEDDADTDTFLSPFRQPGRAPH